MAKVAGKKIDQYSLDSKFIATHDSLRGATRAVNKTSHYTISRNLDKPESSAYGFIWKTHQPKE